MSRGPGKIQQAILAALARKGGWEYAANLAVEMPGAGTRAREVSALRAVRSLALAGKLCTATVCVRARHGRRRYVVCWLPGQGPPWPGVREPVPVKPGDHYGQRYGTDGLRPATITVGVLEHLRQRDSAAPYTAIVTAVSRHVRRRCYVATRRAVLLLEREGKVRLSRSKDGQGRDRIDSVTLVEQTR